MIRPATEADVLTIVQIVVEFFSQGELDGTGLSLDPDTIEYFAGDAIYDESACILVAEEDGVIVGVIAGVVRPWWLNAEILVLSELGWFVPKQYRESHPRAAYGLLRALKTWGKAKGATVLNIVSTAREESPRVMDFYRAQGLRNIDNNFVGRL